MSHAPSQTFTVLPRSVRVRPSLVAGNGQQSQAPPPYYAENKALEHSLDHALAMEDSKTPAYSQPGYGYHQPNHNINGTYGRIRRDSFRRP